MLFNGKITIANRTLAHVLVSLWKASPLTLGATERPLNFANKKPGEVFRRGFQAGGRGDKIKIFGGKYRIHVEPFSLERQEEVRSSRTKIGFTLTQKPQDIANSISQSKVAQLYHTSVEEIVAGVHSSGEFLDDPSLGKETWESLRNGLQPLKSQPFKDAAMSILKWAFQLYSHSSAQSFLEEEGVDAWRAVVGSGEFDGMTVMDFMSAMAALLPQMRNAASLVGVLLNAAGMSAEQVDAVEEAAWQLQMEEWASNRLLSTLIEEDVPADGRQLAVLGGPEKTVHLADWRMKLVQVDDVDCYSPFDDSGAPS